jgi:hypothetical protein
MVPEKKKLFNSPHNIDGYTNQTKNVKITTNNYSHYTLILFN